MSKDFFKTISKNVDNSLTAIASEDEIGKIVDYIDTGNYALNALISGSIFRGIPSNRIIMLAGPEATGKSFFSLTLAKNFLNAQDESAVIRFDSEFETDIESLRDKGIDLDRIQIRRVKTVEDFRTQAIQLIENYKSIDGDKPKIMIILDSLGNLSTQKEVEDIQKGNTTADMTRARLIKGAFRVLTVDCGVANVPLIVVNHTYDSIGAYVPQKKASGGSGPQYAATTTIILGKKNNKDKDGVIITCKLDKSRLTHSGRKIEVELSYSHGLKKYSGLLPIAEEAGIFVKDGNKYVVGDGSKQFEKTINNNPEQFFTEDILNQIDKYTMDTFRYKN